MSKRRYRSVSLSLMSMVCALVGLTTPLPVTYADVTPSGDAYLDGSTYYVGHTADGQLMIDAGSDLSTSRGYLGYNTATTGTVTVTGTGSTWTNSQFLYVGYNGTGNIHLENGGQINQASSTDFPSYSLPTLLGYNLGSIGNVTISGNGTKWTTSASLTIGIAGEGHLRIENGGQYNFAFSGPPYYINNSIRLGLLSTGKGSITVTGANSRLDMGSGGIISSTSKGTLLIEDGGKLMNANMLITSGSSSSGSVKVRGPESSWTSSTINLGLQGQLTVEDGGQVTTRTLYASASNLYGNGTIHATSGAVLDADIVIDNSRGLSQTLAFGNGGQLHLTIDGTSVFGVGHSANGSLLVTDGKTLASGSGYLGYHTGSVGTAIITGNGSKWTNNGQLYIGQAGSGDLTVENGGLVTAKTLYASPSDLHGDGTINVYSGLVIDADIVIDSTRGLSQSLAFGSGGILNFTLDGNSDVGVGYKGVGTLRVADSRVLKSKGGYLGNRSGSDGSAVITGTGSKWTNAGSLYVGSSGTGYLTIENGAEVSNTLGYLGSSSAASGTVIIRGAGSSWNNTESLDIGVNGTGSIRIENGGRLNSKETDIAMSAGSLGHVVVTGTGSKWILESEPSLYVGKSGNGTLVIDQGGLASCRTAYLGDAVNSVGTLTVTGINSHFDMFGSNSTLYVGNSGTGMLNIMDGGLVETTTAYIGNNADASGQATVSGTGAKWALEGSLFLGFSGTAHLNITDGGLVTAKTFLGSLNDLSGNGMLNTNGVVWDNDLTHDNTHDIFQSYTFGNGGTLNINDNGTGMMGVGYKASANMLVAQGRTLTSSVGYLGYQQGAVGSAVVTGLGSRWTNQGVLFVGLSGTGELLIEDGGEVLGAKGYIANNSGSSGSVTVRGIDSKWVNTGPVYVSLSGNGSLQIENGAQVSSSHGYIGDNPGSTGTVTVAGNDSIWMISDSLFVARNGTGSITVTDGGRISTATLYASLNQLQGNGTINANGVVLDTDLAFDNTQGLNQSLSFGNGGALNLAVNGSGDMGAGYKADGSLYVTDGLNLRSKSGYLGYNKNSHGNAKVNGINSKWTNSSALYIGHSGQGTLVIEDGGQVSNTSGNIGFNSGSIGTVTVKGTNSQWTNSSGLYIGDSGQGTLVIEDGGQVTSQSGSSIVGMNQYANGTVSIRQSNSSWSSSKLTVGYSGNGTVLVENGGLLTTSESTMGYNSTATGSVTIRGNNSRWNNNSLMNIGQYGLGSLHIVQGGQVGNGNRDVYIGEIGTGIVTISGINSKLTNVNAIYLGYGYNGKGTLRLEDGGQANCSWGALGNNSGSNSTAVITGTGSTLTSSRSFYVGFYGNGSLRIENGGQVFNENATVGYYNNAIGDALVTGTGSKWTNTGILYLGDYGTGNLIVADGGHVTARSLTVNNKSTFRLHVNGNDMIVLGNRSGNATHVGGIFNSGKVQFFADAFLESGTYRPVKEFNGLNLTWSGTGTYQAFGGVLDTSQHTFNVMQATTLGSGETQAITTGQRLLITDSDSGQQVGVSFGSITGATTFSAEMLTDEQEANLRSQSEFNGFVLAGWDFVTNFTGDQAMVSFALGTGYDDEDLLLWHLENGVWSQFEPGLETYDAQGNFSFTVTGFSGYAVTASIPEPATLGLLMLGGMMLTSRRRG